MSDLPADTSRPGTSPVPGSGSADRPPAGPGDAPAPAGGAGSPPGLDLDRLTGYLAAHRPGLLGGVARASLFAGGRSNLTYLVRGGDREFVLRRPPLGHLLATAHDMTREFRVISALAGTGVPVPEALLLCTDTTVLGAPFYLMERVPGVVLRDRRQTDRLDAGQRRRLAEAMMDTLAVLHQVEPAAVGLADFGRPEGFLARQVRRWGGQLDRSRSRPLPGIDELRELLARSVPEGANPGRIVHGDYRLDNLVADPDPAPARDPGSDPGPVDPGAGPGRPAPPGPVRAVLEPGPVRAVLEPGPVRAVLEPGPVRAVLDWEMATLGDPLTDLGLLLTYWEVLGDSDLAAGNPVADGLGPRAGFPSGAELIDRYARRADTDVGPLRWHVALGCFKLAVICEGIHYRYTLGRTLGEGFDRIGDLVAPLVEHGLAAAREEA